MPSSSDGRFGLYQTRVKTLGYQTNKLKWKDTLPTSGLYEMEILGGERRSPFCGAIVNQHPPAHHPLDALYKSLVDEPQLS